MANLKLEIVRDITVMFDQMLLLFVAEENSLADATKPRAIIVRRYDRPGSAHSKLSTTSFERETSWTRCLNVLLRLPWEWESKWVFAVLLCAWLYGDRQIEVHLLRLGRMMLLRRWIKSFKQILPWVMKAETQKRFMMMTKTKAKERPKSDYPLRIDARTLS